MTTDSLRLDPLPDNQDTFFSMMEKMLSGDIPQDEMSLLLELVDQSDAYLETADALWAEKLALLDDVPELQPDTAQRIEHMIEKRIHRADFSSELFRVGTQGVASVWTALLRPLFSPSNHWDADQKHAGDDNNDGK